MGLIFFRHAYGRFFKIKGKIETTLLLGLSAGQRGSVPLHEAEPGIQD